MVLTRSSRNRSQTDNRIIPNMEVLTVVSTSHPMYTIASTSATTTITKSSVTPTVQQFMSMAHERSGFHNESVISNSTITSPEYSSITARNVQQVFRASVPPTAPQPANNVATTPDMCNFIREEMQRQIQAIRQELSQAISRAVSQASPPQPAAPQTPVGQHNNVLHNIQPQSQMNIPVNINQFPYASQPVPGQAANQLPQYPPPNLNYNPVFPPTQSSQAPSLPNEHPFSTQRKVDLSKWGIKFDGSTKSMSAEDFIFRVDVLRQDYSCPFNELLRSFHVLLEGPALDWYWNLRKLTAIQSWEDLGRAFLTQFKRYESEFQLQKQIMDRRQLPQESFESFYNGVMKLRNQQRTPYTERDLVEIMKSNLKPSLSHLLFSVTTSSLNEFCQQAKRAENLINSQRQTFQSRQPVPARVHELQLGDEVPVSILEIDALATNSRYICWNCKQSGHSFMNCPSPNRRIFCFRCGRDNVVTPKCPKCQGNQVVSESLTGETRSTQT
ncbi:uncharacterized protein LOC135950718 [Calliphora vicina]|uniref:uncharacterized protein LOC135950718 n=1 Tax=Calliphora vicina TaxID=7373 RepID=UPI00325BD8EB